MEKDVFEEKCPEVTFKYYLPENYRDARLHFLASDMYSALWEISQTCRTEIKHGQHEHVAKFAEKIRALIYEVDLDALT